MMPQLTDKEHFEQIKEISTIFSECFDLEFSKLEKNEEKIILGFTYNIFLSTKLHTLFTDLSIQHITELIFENNDIRDFVLCLTDRLGIMLSSLQDGDICAVIAKGIGGGSVLVSRGSTGAPYQDNDTIKYTLMPTKVANNLETSIEPIRLVLIANRWLVTIVLINLFLYKTSVFQNAKEFAMQ